MKYLILAVILTGCSQSPKFAVGDCITDDSVRDPWQRPADIEKVIAVGKETYLYEFNRDYGKVRSDFPIILLDKISIKVKQQDIFKKNESEA